MVTLSSTPVDVRAGRAEAIADAGRSDARLLIVDDNPLNIALLVAIYTRAGYRNVFTELDSRQVVARIAEVDPDLVLLDLHMPHVDGFEVLAQIRQIAPAEALPVMVLTADTTAVASDRALGAGAQDFVTKPFSNGEVLVRSGNLLRARLLYTTLRTSTLLHREAVEGQQALARELSSEQQSGDRLRFLSTVKDTLLQTVSHDLRSPIWAVQVLIDVLEADARGAAPLSAESRLDIIMKVGLNASRMDRLLHDILDSDPMRVVDDHQIMCDVGDVVRGVLADLDIGASFPLQVDIAPGRANVDPAHLERIIVNLLNNAYQHLTPGTQVWVRVAAREGGMEIAVEDAGPGVSTELAETIFQPFRRGADSTGQGLGLGLSLVSRFAELHGGRAWAENRVGGGASFRVFLPSAVPPDCDSSTTMDVDR